jgi:ATP-dependent RNA helicase SUPV3L1/SUV3
MMSDRPSGAAPSRVVAVLGPTNTGKTHMAVERMMAHESGMIGLPLRLLAREIYDRIVMLRGRSRVALITGEEKIVPQNAAYFVCTVEAMPLTREVAFLAIDEIQLCADPERGHIFTQRLLNARGKAETMLLGAGTMAPLVRRLLPEAEIVFRERLSTLHYAGSKKLTRLPRRSAIVAFSAEAVYGIAELMRRQRGGAAVVMGALSPRTRNAQVALYQSGEVDFLIATDAIGMGLNMDVDHVAFAGLRKFDGRRSRWLHATEVAQIAGRAGRFTRDGTFGTTADCEPMDEDLVVAVETHEFEPVRAAEWRNGRLDFTNLRELMASLARPPGRDGLLLTRESLDERSLKALAAEPEFAGRCRDRASLMRMWEVCQTPDFRKVSPDEHLRLLRDLSIALTSGRRRVGDDWMVAQFDPLDRTDGEIETLSARLASVRTLAYMANHQDWLADAKEWRGRTHGLEERLSDTLHEKLMARFIDRRTSVLMRQLGMGDEILAGVAGDGVVSVDGYVIGRLRGIAFAPEDGHSALDSKALRAAADRAVTPEVTRRLGAMAAENDDAFALSPDGFVLWHGEAAGVVRPGRRVRLLGELGPAPARERASRRLEAFIATQAQRHLAPLEALRSAIAGGELRGLPRGLAHRLAETGGVIDRRLVEAEVAGLSQAERRSLRALGVRLGAFSLYLPGLLSADAISCAQILAADEWRPPLDAVAPLPDPAPQPTALSARGLRAVGGRTAPVEALERLGEALRAARQDHGASPLTLAMLEAMAWSQQDAEAILRGLGFTPVREQGDRPAGWRLRRTRTAASGPATNLASPFAALASLTAPVHPPLRRRRPRRKAAQS